MKQGLIDPDWLCKQRWEGSGNDFSSIVQGGGISRQAVWTAHTRAWNPSSKPPCPSAFSLLCFSSSILPVSTFPETSSVLASCAAEECHAYQEAKQPPKSALQKCFHKLCLTQLHSAQLLPTSFIFILIPFLPSIPYSPPSPSHIYPLIKLLYALPSNSSLNPSGGLEAPWGKIFFWQLSWDRKEVLDRSIFHPRKFLILPDALSQTVLLCRCTFKGSQDMCRGQISEPGWKTLNCSRLWFLCFKTTLKFK